MGKVVSDVMTICD